MYICMHVRLYVYMFESVNNSHAHIGIIVVFVFVYYKFTETRPTLNHRQSTKFLTNNKKKSTHREQLQQQQYLGTLMRVLCWSKCMYACVCLCGYINMHFTAFVCLLSYECITYIVCMYEIHQMSDVVK